jgi:hypothetical protein
MVRIVAVAVPVTKRKEVAAIVPMMPEHAEQCLPHLETLGGWGMGTSDDPREIGSVSAELALAGAMVRLEPE